MKILIIADGNHSQIYDGAFEIGFKELGHEVFRFSWNSYFRNYQNKIQLIINKIQNKFTIGPIIDSINKDILNKVIELKPELIFIYRGTHILPKTLNSMKKSIDCKIFGYNNDDPFSKQYPKYFWRHFQDCLKYYDHIFAYREKNVFDYKSLGYENVSILRSYYLKDKNFYISALDTFQYKTDVLFIGHWENDGRDETIKFLLDNGIKIKLYGTLWNKSKYYDYFIKFYDEIVPLYGDEYNIAINSAKIALVFLSKINNDTYTRRCFEIPATKTMMIAEYTDDLNSMFTEGEEAEYFRNKEELLKKISSYLLNENKLIDIGENGHKRLIVDGHEVKDRCSEVIKIYEKSK